MIWERVDEGWGRRAAEFAYLIENLHWREYQHLLDQTGIGQGMRYLDIACGSGLAVRLACERGATACGANSRCFRRACAGHLRHDRRGRRRRQQCGDLVD